MATTKEEVAKAPPAIKVLDIDIQPATIPVRGTTSLISHRWSEKARKEMRDKQQGRATRGRAAKDPEAEYRSSLYLFNGEEDRYGFPSIGFKAAAVEAYKWCGLKKGFLQGSFHINSELVEIIGEPRMREDVVRLRSQYGTTTDLRYRAEFPDWEAYIDVVYDARSITLEQLVNLWRRAGFSVGIGDYRVEREGNHGRFDVMGVQET